MVGSGDSQVGLGGWVGFNPDPFGHLKFVVFDFFLIPYLKVVVALVLASVAAGVAGSTLILAKSGMYGVGFGKIGS